MGSRPLLIDPSKKWFNYEQSGIQGEYISDIDLSELACKCEFYLTKDSKWYIQTKGHDRKSYEWMLRMRDEGTRKDQISSLLLSFEDSPVHNLQSFEMIIRRLIAPEVKCKDIFDLLEQVCQILIDSVLPDRKLIQLNLRPLERSYIRRSEKDLNIRRMLVLWYFEDKLKSLYASLISFMEKKLFRCPLEKLKFSIMKSVLTLLSSKPENESSLLSILVDKIGDPDPATSNEAIKLLKRLVELHPPMKMVVVQNVEKLIFRKNIQASAQYYALCALSQISLERGDEAVAQYLITCYFSLFKLFAATNKDVPGRVMTNLLMGTRLAIQHCADTVEIEPSQLKSVFHVLHNCPAPTSLQAMMLLSQLAKSRPELGDRFLSALYQRLVKDDLTTTRLQEQLLRLVYTACCCDSGQPRRQKAFMKRIMQMALNGSQGFAAASLVLCSELQKSNRKNLNMLAAQNSKHSRAEPRDSGEATSLAYDPTKRNPLYANAEHSVCHELVELSKHYHPTIAFFASQLLQGKPISYDSNPFEDFKLINFLDRFTFKKARIRRHTDRSKEEMLRRLHKSKRIAPQSKGFLNLKEQNVSLDDVFMHRYMKSISKRKASSGEDLLKDENQIDDLFEKYISKRIQLSASTDFASQFNPKIPSPKGTKSRRTRDTVKMELSTDDEENNLRRTSKGRNRKRARRHGNSVVRGSRIDDDGDDFDSLFQNGLDTSAVSYDNISGEKELRQIQWEEGHTKFKKGKSRISQLRRKQRKT